MTLLYNSGNGERRTSFAREKLGSDAYLYCPGPSLKHVRDEDIHVPGVYNFALNTAYPHIKPDMWFGMDHVQCYDRRLWAEPFIKICRKNREEELCGERPVSEYPQVYWVTTKTGMSMEELFQAREHTTAFAWYKHTIGVALHFMIWMGAKKIHFVGCDLSGDYYDGRKLREEDAKENASIYYKLGTNFLPAFTEVGKRYGVECISCTPNSPINKYMDYIPLRAALLSSQSKVPSEGEVLNCREASRREFMKWHQEMIADRGIITAVDSNLEWLLKPWVMNVRKHSRLPICVVDIGMSKEMHEWARSNMNIFDLTNTMLKPDKDKKTFNWQHGWKPFAIMRSPFRHTLFLDIDCEVMGDVEPMFHVDHTDKAASDFAIAKDHLFCNLPVSNELEPNETMHNSGVMLAKHGSLIVERWAKTIMDTDPTDWRTGDQTILSKILLEAQKNIGHTVLLNKYNTLVPGNGHARTGAIILHRLTSHPKTLTYLKTKTDDSFCVDVWLRDAEVFKKCEWPHDPRHEKGVIIGVSREQEWMLPWWHENYKKHNDYPVLVADFGITEDCAKWLCERNIFISSPRIELDGQQWFKKPLGCLQSIFSHTIWLDTDCQVRKNLEPIFKYSNKGVGITVDRGTPQKWKDALPWDATVYNTGCVSFRFGEELIQKWAMMTMAMLRLKTQEGKLLMPAGDQETLALAIRRYGKDKIIEIPKEEMSLRLGGDPEDCIVKHWTGPVGKEEIKRQIAVEALAEKADAFFRKDYQVD